MQRFFSLREKIGRFWSKKGHPMEELSDPVWLADLAFLVDIAKHLNALNVYLQGQDAVVSQLYAHIKAFGPKLQLFQKHCALPSFERRYRQFPTGQHWCANDELCNSYCISFDGN